MREIGGANFALLLCEVIFSWGWKRFGTQLRKGVNPILELFDSIDFGPISL